jgi:hypothetical protein
VVLPADESAARHRLRTARFAQVSTALALLSDRQLAGLVEAAEPMATGIGGTTLRFAIEGHPVFAKRLRLTELERRPEHRLSTANLEALPAFCQRNVGSVGFGAWRELAAHVMTSGWVLSQQLSCFPLMFHWRELDGAQAACAAPLPAELADREGMVAHWEGSPAMAARLRGLAEASASVVIFMEHLPWTLAAWLARQSAAGPATFEAACRRVDAALCTDVPHMNALGLLHGDAHLDNIVTDGEAIYLADFGLATSARFALGPDERDYLQHHASLDRAYVLAKWVNALIKLGCPALESIPARLALVHTLAQGRPAPAVLEGLPKVVTEILHRHAPVADAINTFYGQLHGSSRSAPYPRELIERLLPG